MINHLTLWEEHKNGERKLDAPTPNREKTEEDEEYTSYINMLRYRDGDTGMREE